MAIIMRINVRMNILLVISIICCISTLPRPTHSQTNDCNSPLSYFYTTKQFEYCNKLPTLGAVFRWNYDKQTGKLETAFISESSVKDGWVAFGLNPKAPIMEGTQALMAYKPYAGPITMDTFNVTAVSMEPGPIAYNVANLGTEVNGNIIIIYATWTIPEEERLSVNLVWQVGPMNHGVPKVHRFDPENKNSRIRLCLLTGISTPVEAPAQAPNGQYDSEVGYMTGSPRENGFAEEKNQSYFILAMVSGFVAFVSSYWFI